MIATAAAHRLCRLRLQQLPLLLFAGALGAIAPAKAASPAQFTVFEVPGFAFTEATAINPSGTVAGTCIDSDYNFFAYLRAPNGKIHRFGIGHSAITFITGLNANNDAAGQYLTQTHGYAGFVRTGAGQITRLRPPGAAETYVSGINDKQMIVGYYTDAQGQHGFLRNPAGSFTSFDAPDANRDTVVVGIDNSNTVLGSYFDSSYVQHGFLRSEDGSFTVFQIEGSTETNPLSINAHGQIAGTYYDSQNGVSGFLREPDGTFVTFVAPDGSDTLEHVAIDDRGTITGYYLDLTTYDSHAFLRRPNGAEIGFDGPGSVSTQAESIGPHNAVVGEFYDDKEILHGFIRSR